MNTLIVVGESELAGKVTQLLPNFRVVGVEEDNDLGDAATSLAAIGNLIEEGQTPQAVLCTGSPGFSILSQLRKFPPSRCYVVADSSPWPAPTLACLVEAAGMTMLSALDRLPVALLGKTVEGVRRPGRGEIPAPRGINSEEAVSRIRSAQAQSREHPPASGPPAAADFTWADETPVQVPPPPVSLDEQLEPVALVLEANGNGHADAPFGLAYTPTDLLRPLRPSRS